MPYIYSLGAHSASYCQVSVSGLEGYGRACVAAAHYARIPKIFTYVSHSSGMINYSPSQTKFPPEPLGRWS